MAFKHPRFKYYPQHQDYVEMGGGEFRPFVMFTNRESFRSKAVNTDPYGFREQYDSNGKFLSLENLRENYSSCNVLIGGSSSFGVDASSDMNTISAHLQKPGVPCLNFGIRAATSQQELIAFILFKRFLPQVNNVIIFSGVNHVSMATVEGTIFYPAFGAVFNEQYKFTTFWKQYMLFEPNKYILAEHRLALFINRMSERFKWVRLFMWLLLLWDVKKAVKRKPHIEVAEKLRMMTDYWLNDMHSWQCLQKQMGFKVHFVIQPIIRWTEKVLTSIEAELFEVDTKLIPSMQMYANSNIYKSLREQFAVGCSKNEIDFFDSNEWLNNPMYASQEIFTDVCHLTDYGNHVIAQLLENKLDWKV